MPKRDIHLICNAHLDPVWLWQWQEGAAEAISTFRTAVEMCENNESFIFNHNEVILYKWVQDYEPELFKRIQKLVKAGKWHIMGGWYVQPDCNMPSGESFVRQILLGRTYFKKHFGVEPKTAINFDPFGHTRGLVQILAKSGYDSYLFGRPTPNCLDLPAEDFNWIGYDGSSVMATRFPGWYNTNLGIAKEMISKRLKIDPDRNPMPILWGVGNHGGGPSKIDLRNINKLIAEKKQQFNIKHSTPDAFFKQLKKHRSKLIERKDDINPWAIGCYSSQVRIKQQHRLLENEYFAAEKIVTAAMVNGLMEYPAKQMHQALCDLATCQFHDILPGSSIRAAEEDALHQIGHGLEILSRLKAKAFFALASGQKKAAAGRIPIMVLNHHPVSTSQIVECEFNLADFNIKDTFTQIEVYHNGKKIPSQVERELSKVPIEWRKRVVFAADLSAGQINRFECKPVTVDKKSEPDLKAKNGKIHFKTKALEVIVNCRTGLIDRYRANGVDHVGKDAFKLYALQDNVDAWNMLENRYEGKAEPFTLMSKTESAGFSGAHCRYLDSVRVVEDGPVRSVIEAVFKYGDSFVCQQYKLPKAGTEIEIEIRVHWNEKDKLLKLAIPVKGKSPKYLGQVAYGRQQLPDEGYEAVSQKWSAVVSENDNRAFTCINNGTYSSDFNSGLLRLTLLRSPIYSGHANLKHELFVPYNRYTERIDQGFREFKFWFNAGKVKDRLEAIDTEALFKNEKPFAISFFPAGTGKKPKPMVKISDKAVQVTAVKKAESGNYVIIRLFEPTGKKRNLTISMPVIAKKFKIAIMPFEILTLRVDLRTKKISQVNLIERPVRNGRSLQAEIHRTSRRKK